uniref:Nudix hydrolase domain-containing protein n=1 Tax=Trieres chinensis TaxID=1514140 RepID=A0A7S1ZC58_TRICV|mmetsp:Transcript_22374/g.45291  ORF Transcript_22374/g.45291 Transcript_22374/m.45291 type:complete len:243 (+) Transcript_22374:145-873(+)
MCEAHRDLLVLLAPRGNKFQSQQDASMSAIKNPHALSSAQDDAELFDVMEPPPSDPHGFDIYHDRPKPTGEKKPRKAVHAHHDWHRSAHVWLVDPVRRLVALQKRSDQKDTFPGRWDISAAGHVEAGVGDSRETAERELAEELGITLPGKDNVGTLSFGFTCPAEQASLGGCNCYEDVYFLVVDSSTCDFAVGGAEVSAVRWESIETLELALRRHDEAYVPRVEKYLCAFFPHLENICAKEV